MVGGYIMLGRSYIIGPRLNNNKWDLGNLLGVGFENHIYNVLSMNLEKYYNTGTKIYQTPKSKDNGKDIIIESPVSLMDVLGTNFYIRNNSKIKIYIECKSSNHSKISYNSFAGNLSRISADNVSYYVLVTNSTIVPYSYYQFKKEAEKLGIQFILIDQFLLLQYLLRNNAMIGELTLKENFNKIYIEYQANSCVIESNNAYEVFFWLRNYSEVSQMISMKLNTDRNWSTDLSDVEQLIEAKDSYCFKFIVVKEYFDGINDLILNVKSNLFDTSIQLKGINVLYNFRPEMIGKKNKKIVKKLNDNIINAHASNIFLMTGEAGVGKTRIVDELLSLLAGRNINFYRILVQKNKNVLPVLQDLLIKGNYLDPSLVYNSIEDVFSSIDVKYRKCVIILDDLHNASLQLLNDIRD